MVSLSALASVRIREGNGLLGTWTKQKLLQLKVEKATNRHACDAHSQEVKHTHTHTHTKPIAL